MNVPSFSFHLLLHYTQERRAKKLLDFRRVDFPSAVARRSFTLESIRIIPPGNVSSVCVYVSNASVVVCKAGCEL